MSVQADTEMISIQAMETYAKKNHISGEEAIELFHQYQIFEKIMIQHEYLHQVSFEEVMEYVEKVIGEDTHQLAVFHGTTKRFDVIDLKKSHNRRDFGMVGVHQAKPVRGRASAWLRYCNRTSGR